MVKLQKIIFSTDAGDIDLTYDEAFGLYRELQVLFSGTKKPTKKSNVQKLTAEEIKELAKDVYDKTKYHDLIKPTCGPMEIMYSCECDTTKVSDY